MASLFSIFLLSLLATLGADGVIGSRQCQRIPSMTAESACTAVTGTPHMRELCIRTLLPSGAGTSSGTAAAPVPVTRHAAAAVQAALGSYAATVAAATSLLDGGAVAADDEKAAVGDCMVGYGRARIAMARVAGDLEPADGGCGDTEAGLRAGYTAGLRGMDGCRRSLIDFPASPLVDRNLADRNMTLLVALLCSLVPAPLA
ncbi:unnamed protein product [Urochloa decumbens]|uniref:Pectinesterase inhibitor domain-containing protein n=1 Tax=Urochloa decumbens TaxID=240449 RepID=A0ABC9BNE4_9POAL